MSWQVWLVKVWGHTCAKMRTLVIISLQEDRIQTPTMVKKKYDSVCIAMCGWQKYDSILVPKGQKLVIIIIIIAFQGAIRDFFTISSLRREPSSTCTLKWPGRNRVQITCNTSSAYHMQHVVLRVTWYKGTAQLLSLTESKSLLFQLYFIGWTINWWRLSDQVMISLFTLVCCQVLLRPCVKSNMIIKELEFLDKYLLLISCLMAH